MRTNPRLEVHDAAHIPGSWWALNRDPTTLMSCLNAAKTDISSTPGPLNMPLVSQQEQASNHHGSQRLKTQPLSHWVLRNQVHAIDTLAQTTCQQASRSHLVLKLTAQMGQGFSLSRPLWQISSPFQDHHLLQSWRWWLSRPWQLWHDWHDVPRRLGHDMTDMESTAQERLHGPWACEAIEVLVSDYDAWGGPRLRVTLARMPRRSTWHISTSND